MSRLTFGDNFKDLSTDHTFQFEFTCDRCHKAWQSPPVPYDAKPTTRSVSNAAESAVGTGAVIEGKVGDAAYETARAYALDAAVEEAMWRFNQCRLCGNWFCEKCFDRNYVMCVHCRLA
ncbi:MAG: hypothetical protein NZT92_19115 [Abditibacteriales bacterium]|nr:hypothetical protein [Abditibacteriales bacterium]MDW8366959.1 hypothetical protein [Abditibacteriales bacterium]